MRNSKILQYLLKMMVLTAFITLESSTFSGTPIRVTESCSRPTPSVTAKNSTSVSFAWSAVSGANSYTVWYVRKSDGYQSGESTSTSTNITFSGLPSGVYDCYFKTNCESEISEYIIIEVVI